MTEPDRELAGLAKLPAGLVSTGDGSIQAQAALLGDPQLLGTQRRGMAIQIGKVQGNQHLQRAVASMRWNRRWVDPKPVLPQAQVDRSMPRRCPYGIQRHPDPDPTIIVEYEGQEIPFETRDALARFLASLTNVIGHRAEELAERDQSIYRYVTEMARTHITTTNLRMGLIGLAESDETAEGIARDIITDREALLDAIAEAEGNERSRHAREIADQIERACTRMERQRQQLLQQMHRAFRANNTEVIGEITGAYGQIGGLIDEATRAYDGLREWNGRSSLNISVLSNFLGRGIAVVNYFSGLGDEIPGLASSTEEALGLLTRAYNTAGTVTTLLNVSPTMYGMFTVHIGPALSAICSGWSRIEDQLRNRNDIWYEAYGAEAVDWSREPGGRAVYDYLASVFAASGPGEVPPIPDDVGEFFLDHRALLNAAMQALGFEEMPTERAWTILWQRLRREQFKEWIFHNREFVWRLIYGTARPFPTG